MEHVADASSRRLRALRVQGGDVAVERAERNAERLGQHGFADGAAIAAQRLDEIEQTFARDIGPAVERNPISLSWNAASLCQHRRRPLAAKVSSRSPS